LLAEPVSLTFRRAAAILRPFFIVSARRRFGRQWRKVYGVGIAIVHNIPYLEDNIDRLTSLEVPS
jgi:hypothetical protein